MQAALQASDDRLHSSLPPDCPNALEHLIPREVSSRFSHGFLGRDAAPEVSRLNVYVKPHPLRVAIGAKYAEDGLLKFRLDKCLPAVHAVVRRPASYADL